MSPSLRQLLLIACGLYAPLFSFVTVCALLSIGGGAENDIGHFDEGGPVVASITFGIAAIVSWIATFKLLRRRP